MYCCICKIFFNESTNNQENEEESLSAKVVGGIIKNQLKPIKDDLEYIKKQVDAIRDRVNGLATRIEEIEKALTKVKVA